MWFAIYSYPDLAYLVGVFSCFCSNSGLVYVELVKHILQYISDILELDLIFDREVNTLNDVIWYINSNFVRLKIDWKSSGSYVFILIGAVISHLSKL